MNRLLHVCSFQNRFDNLPRQCAEVTWEELVRRLKRHREWKDRDGELWSPVLYKPGTTRAIENTVLLDCFVLDMDRGDAWEQYLERWADLEFVIHTSYRHTAAAPRWRAVFPLTDPQPGGEAWKPIWTRLAWGLARHTSDASCIDPCRMYYLPSHPPGSEDHFVLHHEGRWLDPTLYTDHPPPPPAPPKPTGEIPRERAGRVDGMHLVDRAIQITRFDGWHAGCKWLMIQAKDNGFAQTEAQSLGEVYVHQAPRDKTADKLPPYHQKEMERTLAWAFAKPVRDRWTPKTWEAPVPPPDPPPAAKEQATEDYFAPPMAEEPPGGLPPTDPPQATGGEDQPAPRRILITAPELMALNLPPRRYAVPGILPEGLGIFAGKTKTGKSWAALGIGVAVATGGRVFGKHRVEQGDVLYLALEDNEESLQERLGLLLQGEPPPPRLTFALEWRRTNEGGLENIEKWLSARPDARLVMVDVLTKIRPRSRGSSNNQQYEEDYEVCDPLKRMADRYGVAILLLHHLRKLTSEDPLDQILGSVGMSGAPDTAWVFRRARKDPRATLLITGRRIREEQERALQWDGPAVSWLDLGDADELDHSREQEEVLCYLRESGSGPKRLKQIADALAKSPDAVRKLCQKLKDDGHIVSEAWGTYALRETLF
jgi:hypothetical protein